MPCIWPLAILTISSQRDFIWIFKVFLPQRGCTTDIKWQGWSKESFDSRIFLGVGKFGKYFSHAGTQDKVILKTFIIMKVSKSCCFNKDQETVITKQQRTKRLEYYGYFERCVIINELGRISVTLLGFSLFLLVYSF